MRETAVIAAAAAPSVAHKLLTILKRVLRAPINRSVRKLFLYGIEDRDVFGRSGTVGADVPQGIERYASRLIP